MDVQDLTKAVKAGDRRALARAITLVESGRADHRGQALALVAALGGARQALRLGLSGTPGVGKSSFIETFGLMLTAQGLRVAVLAVDPSSARTGGSILGDKTRMELLSRDPRAFIRPSPSQAQLGGVARRTCQEGTLSKYITKVINKGYLRMILFITLLLKLPFFVVVINYRRVKTQKLSNFLEFH